MANPYAGRPENAFWSTGVAKASRPVPADFYHPKWPIPLETRVATAGSCFAQHIGRRMLAAGYPIMDVEPPPALLTKDRHLEYGYATYSARYGNIYTVRQLLRLAEEAFGQRPPSDLVWTRGDRFVDALRPNIEPLGLSSPEVVLQHRRRHLDRVRTMFMELDLFIFTLGLTESWLDVPTGLTLPVVPGTRAGGTFEPDRHHFHNLSYTETLEDFLAFRELLQRVRPGRPPLFLITVSPVPLVATARDQHVQVSTVHSKSTLRTVAGDLAARFEDIDYFPSYEIITSPWSGSCFFEKDMRSVRSEGVENVMRTFMGAHRPGEAGSTATTSIRRTEPASAREQPDDMAVACEEELLEAFADT